MKPCKAKWHNYYLDLVVVIPLCHPDLHLLFPFSLYQTIHTGLTQEVFCKNKIQFL